jgi:23S rRNA (uridine2552-2'-O)-methyltransferase
MAPVAGVHFIEGDARDPGTLTQVRAYFEARRADLVLSDIAPNITGIRDLDEANFLELADTVRDLAVELLCTGGSLVIKLFQYPGTDSYVRDLKHSFATVVRRKPDSSRKTSREFYVVAKGFEL